MFNYRLTSKKDMVRGFRKEESKKAKNIPRIDQ